MRVKLIKSKLRVKHFFYRLSVKTTHYVKCSFKAYKDSSINLLPANIAFFTLWSIVPIIILWDFALKFLSTLTNQTVVNTIEIVEDTLDVSSIDLSLSVGSVALMIFIIYLASRAFVSIITATNYVYKFTKNTNYFKVKAKSFLFAILLIITFMLMLIIPVLGNEIVRLFEDVFGQNLLLDRLEDTRWIASFIYLFIVLLAIYKFSPSERIKFRYFVPGTLFATIGWIVVSLGYSIYISSYADYTKVYSSFSSVIILMIWIYLLSNILIIGLVINATYFEEKEIGKFSVPKQEI